MNWESILEFARGPLFYASLVIFAGGMTYRLVRVVALGWSRDKVDSKGSKLKGAFVSYLKGIVAWPFIPWVKNTFSKNPVTFIAGGVFHLGLFVILVLGTPHMLVWKSLTGVGWSTAPLPVVDWFAAATIVCMLILLVNRYVNSVLRLISGIPEKFNWLVVFLPMITGYMLTHHLFLRYEVMYSLHMISVDLLLVWIPMSRISHFMFYFFSKTIHGAQFGKRAVKP